jgi:hypothetical protein
MNLSGEPSAAVAQLLDEKRIPFLFATGYGKAALQEKAVGHPVLVKPFDVAAPRVALAVLFAAKPYFDRDPGIRAGDSAPGAATAREDRN